MSLMTSDTLSKDELQVKLGKSGKITSTRLGELVKNDLVMKTADEKFKITTFGVIQMQKEILPKINAKISA
jgi:predicted transcriptional regulator